MEHKFVKITSFLFLAISIITFVICYFTNFVLTLFPTNYTIYEYAVELAPLIVFPLIVFWYNNNQQKIKEEEEVNKEANVIRKMLLKDFNELRTPLLNCNAAIHTLDLSHTDFSDISISILVKQTLDDLSTFLAKYVTFTSYTKIYLEQAIIDKIDVLLYEISAEITDKHQLWFNKKEFGYNKFTIARKAGIIEAILLMSNIITTKHNTLDIEELEKRIKLIGTEKDKPEA